MKKQLIAIILVLILSLSAIAPAFAENYWLAVVNNPNPAHRLNLRSGPSKYHESIGKYVNGVVVKVFENQGGSWVRVCIGDGEGAAEGYMDSTFLMDPLQQLINPVTVQKVASSKGSDCVWLMADPNAHSAMIIPLPNGTVVTELGYCDKYAHVQVNGITGYLASSTLKDIDTPENDDEEVVFVPGLTVDDIPAMDEEISSLIAIEDFWLGRATVSGYTELMETVTSNHVIGHLLKGEVVYIEAIYDLGMVYVTADNGHSGWMSVETLQQTGRPTGIQIGNATIQSKIAIDRYTSLPAGTPVRVIAVDGEMGALITYSAGSGYDGNSEGRWVPFGALAQ